ncbi:enoyl-CoA hydratase-related protein [Cupriavidus basilensis]
MEHIEVVADRGVMLIGLNRPERKNAITADMYGALAVSIRDAGRRGEIRAVVIHCSEEAFTSGNDVADFADPRSEATSSPSYEFMRAVVDLEKPLLAAVSGPAIGIGATLLLHCDFVFSDETATIQFPFARLGLCPEFGSSQLLPNNVGTRKATELLLLGEPRTAQDAAECGLINIPARTALEHTMAVARKLIALPPGAIRATRSLIRRSEDEGKLGRIDVELAEFAIRLRSADAKDAVAAFFERRAPDFSLFS